MSNIISSETGRPTRCRYAIYPHAIIFSELDTSVFMSPFGAQICGSNLSLYLTYGNWRDKKLCIKLDIAAAAALAGLHFVSGTVGQCA